MLQFIKFKKGETIIKSMVKKGALLAAGLMMLTTTSGLAKKLGINVKVDATGATAAFQAIDRA